MVLTMIRQLQFPFVCFLLLDVCGAAGGKFFYPEEKDMAGWGVACATNNDQQSPIDLPTRQNLNRLPLYANYSENAKWQMEDKELKFVPNATNPTLELDVSALGYTEKAQLLQFHWHTGSENRINGKQYAAEVHFVHTTPETPSGLLVLGVLVDLSPEDGEEMEDFLTFFESNTVDTDVIFDVNMLTKNLDLGQYYDWMGSLTTPGCNLGVKWILSGTILDISIEQLARMVKAMTFAGNFRMPQPIGDRIIGPPAMPGDSDYEDGMGDSTVYIEDEDVKNVMLGLGISVVVLVCFLCAVVMKLACCPDVLTNKKSLLPGAKRAETNKHYMTNTVRANQEISLSLTGGQKAHAAD